MVHVGEGGKMTDREMLELAAKAAGFGDPEGNFIWTESEYPRGSKTNGALWNYIGWCDTAQLWNPLTDDGDALRLAVKLELEVSLGQFGTIIYPRHGKVEEIGEDGCDEMALCRRAITRAAAQMGKEME